MSFLILSLQGLKESLVEEQGHYVIMKQICRDDLDQERWL